MQLVFAFDRTTKIGLISAVYEENVPVRLETRPPPEANHYDELTLARSRPASRTRQPGNNGYLTPPAAAAAPDSNAVRPSSGGYLTPVPTDREQRDRDYITPIPDAAPDYENAK